MFNFHSDNEVIVLMEAILDRLKEDYRLLWYIKNNVKNGGNYLFTNGSNSKKDDEIRLAGCAGSVNSELIKMEEYLKDVFPYCADEIIQYLRETSVNKRIANTVRCMKISA